MFELCIDTSSGAAVAVVSDGKTLGRAREQSPRRHAESLTPLVLSAVQAAGLGDRVADVPWGRICVGTGPAPFTGLRAGLITATVFAKAWNIPAYGVPSLAIIGRQALDVLPEDTQVLVVTDARRQEVYWAKYAASGPNSVTVLDEPQVARPEQLVAALRGPRTLVVGPGTALVKDALQVTPALTEDADPAVLSRLVSSFLRQDPPAAMPVEPLYLRRPHINR